MALGLLASVLVASRCATKNGAVDAPRIAVYESAPGPGGNVDMPAGCRLLRESPPREMSELDLALPDSIRGDRERAAASGANVLLLVETLVAPRHDSDCAAAQRILDCPNTLGAWYRVVLRAYDCDAAAKALLPPVGSPRTAAGFAPPPARAGSF
jgi:hypothetical protein